MVAKKGRESEGYSTREYACISHTSIPGKDTLFPFVHKQLKGQGHEIDFKTFSKN
jgi:hypothetical protein